jgi:biopolymer transport protein ExbB/TolQ
MVTATVAHNIEQIIYYASKILLYPVLVAAVICLLWVLVELGWLLYEVYLRVRYRDLEALEIRTLRAREAFANGQPRKAYRYLQENTYSMVVVRFLFELIRNYQTQQLAAKPLKLLQEYEFYTIKRLEKTRILVRIGPMLGLMGTLIPLAPALTALANGDTARMADQLKIAFSVTVIGLLIGGLAFMVSVFRDRFYSQDISDLEYLLELLEGNATRLSGGVAKTREKPKKGKGKHKAIDADAADDEDLPVVPPLPPDEELVAAGGSPSTTFVQPPGGLDEGMHTVVIDQSQLADALEGDPGLASEAQLTAELSVDDIMRGLQADLDERGHDGDPR